MIFFCLNKDQFWFLLTLRTSSAEIRRKNPAYGRQSISRPMRIVAPMPQEGEPRQNQQKKKTFFARQFQTTSKLKCSNVRPLLSITFPHIGHPTSGSGGKKTVKRFLKSEQTDKQTNRQTDRRTFQLLESIGPEGQCFENNFTPQQPMRCSQGSFRNSRDVLLRNIFRITFQDSLKNIRLILLVFICNKRTYLVSSNSNYLNHCIRDLFS